MKRDFPISLKNGRLLRNPSLNKMAIIVAIIVFVGVLWFVWQANHAQGNLPKDDSNVNTPQTFDLTAGDFVQVENKELNISLPISGSLAPLQHAVLRARSSAEVHEITVREGMRVGIGQVLVRLDTRSLSANLAAAQAAFDEARADVALAQKSRDSSEALYKQKFISQNAFDTTQNTMEARDAEMKAAAARLELARIALDEATIHSPIDGFVSRQFVQPGEKVLPDAPLLTVLNLAQLTLEAQVPASEIARVRVNQEVLFRADGLENKIFRGKVARINPATEEGSRTVLVHISVDNVDGILKGGMFAKGNIIIDKSKKNPVVPLAALHHENGTDAVYKIVGDRIVVQRVVIGLIDLDQGQVEIREGLSPGEHILAAKLDGVLPGSRVRLPAGGV